MGQLGFFDLNRRYESLDEKNDPLVAIAAMVPFESFRSKLKAALIKGELRTSDATRKSLAGRKPWDEVMIFKALVLQALYNLSDDQAEYQLRDRLSFMRFLGWNWRRRFPTPRLCGSIARRWGKRARWKSCLICLTGS
jgi:IS5 family transposase